MMPAQKPGRETYEQIIAREKKSGIPDFIGDSEVITQSVENFVPIGNSNSTVRHNTDGTSEYNISEDITPSEASEEEIQELNSVDIFIQTRQNLNTILRVNKLMEVFLLDEMYFTKQEFHLIKEVTTRLKILCSDMLLREHIQFDDVFGEE